MRHVRALGATLILAAALIVGSHGPVAAEPNEAVGDAQSAAAALSAGAYATCVVGNDGSARCWGANGAGQLGQGDTDHRGDAPDDLGDALAAIDLGSGRTARSISIGGSHACALLDDDTVTCWGFSANGQLGQGITTTVGDEPGELGENLSVIDLGTGRTATAISAGASHTCAVLDNGAAKCWGQGFFGQLGYGDTINRGDNADEMGDELPAIDLGAGRTAQAIAAGDLHTCALLDNGTVRCWGTNSNGELGLGDTRSRANEEGDGVTAIDLGTGRTATAIAVGATHTCAVLDNGAAKCWGDNSYGQLGQGDTDARGDNAGELGDALPAIDLGAGRTATAISAGATHTCALLDNGTVKCWGNNQVGELGQGTSDDMVGDQPGDMGANLPAVNLGAGRHAVAVAAGTDHTCALRDNATVTCWGDAFFGQTGRGSDVDSGSSPTDMGDALIPVDLSAATGPAAARSTLTANKTTVNVGDTITYTATLRNVGGSDLTGLAVSSTTASGCNRTLPTLPIGGTTTFTCTDVAAVGDAPTLTNRLTITSDQGVTRVTSAAVTVRRPVVRSLGVTFSANPTSVYVGDTINYVGKITNTGDVTLENVTYQTGAQYVSRTGSCDGTIATLRVGQTVTVTCTHVVGRGASPKVHKMLTASATGALSVSAVTVVDVERVRARVDGMLGWKGKGAVVVYGDNVYGSADGQTLHPQFSYGSTREFIWRVQNDGNTTQGFTLQGARGNEGYTVSYKMGNKDVTRKVNRGKLKVKLGSGRSTDVTVVLTRNNHRMDGVVVELTARGPLKTVDTVAIHARTIRD